jgi:hypothetical protein
MITILMYRGEFSVALKLLVERVFEKNMHVKKLKTTNRHTYWANKFNSLLVDVCKQLNNEEHLKRLVEHLRRFFKDELRLFGSVERSVLRKAIGVLSQLLRQHVFDLQTIVNAPEPPSRASSSKGVISFDLNDESAFAESAFAESAFAESAFAESQLDTQFDTQGDTQPLQNEPSEKQKAQNEIESIGKTAQLMWQTLSECDKDNPPDEFTNELVALSQILFDIAQKQMPSFDELISKPQALPKRIFVAKPVEKKNPKPRAAKPKAAICANCSYMVESFESSVVCPGCGARVEITQPRARPQKPSQGEQFQPQRDAVCYLCAWFVIMAHLAGRQHRHAIHNCRRDVFEPRRRQVGPNHSQLSNSDRLQVRAKEEWASVDLGDSARPAVQRSLRSVSRQAFHG